jgi:hypothetical protein
LTLVNKEGISSSTALGLPSICLRLPTLVVGCVLGLHPGCDSFSSMLVIPNDISLQSGQHRAPGTSCTNELFKQTPIGLSNNQPAIIVNRVTQPSFVALWRGLDPIHSGCGRRAHLHPRPWHPLGAQPSCTSASKSIYF